MYTGSLQQLQMIQQAELALQEQGAPALSEAVSGPDGTTSASTDTASAPTEVPPAPAETAPVSHPLILGMAWRWDKLWSGISERRHLGTTRPRRPRAV